MKIRRQRYHTLAWYFTFYTTLCNKILTRLDMLIISTIQPVNKNEYYPHFMSSYFAKIVVSPYRSSWTMFLLTSTFFPSAYSKIYVIPVICFSKPFFVFLQCRTSYTLPWSDHQAAPQQNHQLGWWFPAVQAMNCSNFPWIPWMKGNSWI